MRAPDDPEQGRVLRSAWRRVVDQYLPIAMRRGGLIGMAARAGSSLALDAVAKGLLLRTATGLAGSGYTTLNIAEAQRSFKDRDVGGPTSKRNVYTAVLRLLRDYQPVDAVRGAFTVPLTSAEAQLRAAVDANDSLTMFVVTMLLARRLSAGEPGAVAMTEELFEQAMQADRNGPDGAGRPNTYVALLVVAMGAALDGLTGEAVAATEDLWKLYERCVVRWWQASGNRCWGKSSRSEPTIQWMEQCHYLYLLNARYGLQHEATPVVPDTLEDLERDQDWTHLGDLLWQVSDMQCRYGFRPDLAQFLLQYRTENQPEAVRDRMLDGFARMASYIRQPVYDFLAQEEGIDDDFRERVRAKRPDESVYHIIGRQGFNFWRTYVAQQPSPHVMKYVDLVFTHALHVGSMDRWLTDMARVVANALHDEVLFPLRCGCSDRIRP
jgi:hypothetical protein